MSPRRQVPGVSGLSFPVEFKGSAFANTPARWPTGFRWSGTSAIRPTEPWSW